MGELRDFSKPAKKRAPQAVPAPSKDPIQETLDALKEAIALGGVHMLAIVTVTRDGPNHLIWGDGSLTDAAQILLALRVASDEIVDGVTTDSCVECGCPLDEGPGEKPS